MKVVVFYYDENMNKNLITIIWCLFYPVMYFVIDGFWNLAGAGHFIFIPCIPLSIALTVAITLVGIMGGIFMATENAKPASRIGFIVSAHPLYTLAYKATQWLAQPV